MIAKNTLRITEVFLWNWTKPILPYKMGIFSQGFWALKVLPPPWPPSSKLYEIGGFQKGTTCPFASRGCKVTGCQTFSFFKNCTFLFMYHIFIWKQRHLWTLLIFWSTKTLTACNFAAPWGKWTSSTFLETSNLIELGARWSWGWQDF